MQKLCARGDGADKLQYHGIMRGSCGIAGLYRIMVSWKKVPANTGNQV
ncbi:hypothetical protein [Bilifractor sp. HCP3S3_D3]